jgi:hypothetical protein
MPRLLHLSGEQDPRLKAKTSSRTRVLLLDAEGAEHDRAQEARGLAFDVSATTLAAAPGEALLSQPRPFYRHPQAQITPTSRHARLISS